MAIPRLIPPGHPSSGGLYIVHPETLRRGLFGGEGVEMGVQGLFRDALVLCDNIKMVIFASK